MKIYLDDERPTPKGWHRVYWPEEAIVLLQQGTVTEISLDHDLGDDAHGTGYDVVLWIEEAVATQVFNHRLYGFTALIHQQDRKWNPESLISKG